MRSRQQIREEVLAYADRGWVSPQVAMAAIQGGTAEKLIQGYELDVARANRIIQAIRQGTVMDMGSWMAKDPLSGETAEQPIYVEGDLKLNGQAWILGGLIVKGKTSVKMNGGATILYSSEAITRALKPLSSVSSTSQSPLPGVCPLTSATRFERATMCGTAT